LSIVQDTSEYIRLTVTDNWFVIATQYGHIFDNDSNTDLDGEGVTLNKHSTAIGYSYDFTGTIKELEDTSTDIPLTNLDTTQASFINTLKSGLIDSDPRVDFSALSDEQWLEMLIS